MELKECYRAFGGDLQEVLGRLPGENLVRKLLRKFPEDPSFGELTAALGSGDRETAFRCAHNLKGLCLNLGFPELLRSSSELTEALRAGTEYREDTVQALLKQVLEDHRRICDAVAELD